MIFWILYFWAKIVKSEANRTPYVGLTVSCIFNNENTECIEMCTDVCLKDEDIYGCFNNCTLVECPGDQLEEYNLKMSYVYIPYSIVGIFVVWLLARTFRTSRELENNFDYWRIQG